MVEDAKGRPTLQRGSTKTSVRVCVPCCLSGLVSVKVWNRSDRKHLLFPAVTCYPFSWGESGESLFLPAGGCQHRLNPTKPCQADFELRELLPVTPAAQAYRCHGDGEVLGPGGVSGRWAKLICWFDKEHVRLQTSKVKMISQNKLHHRVFAWLFHYFYSTSEILKDRNVLYDSTMQTILVFFICTPHLNTS